MLDQTRWQPWEYQYLFIVLIFIFNFKKIERIYSVMIFLLACIYCYSGLHKLNESFLGMIWEGMMLRSFFHAPTHIVNYTFVHYAGYLLAALELCAGFGLLFKKTRKICAYILITMHLFNLLFLGPLGLRYNIIVWPWNVVMITYLYLLCIDKKTNISTYSWEHVLALRNIAVVIAWAIMPAFCFVNLWDNYLSSNLYSGKLPLLAICVKDTNSIKELQPFISIKDKNNICIGDAMLNVQNWAMKEMQVPPYPEIRTYKKLQTAFNKKYPTANATFILYYYPYDSTKFVELK